VFEEVRPLVQSALDGYNVTFLAYGQTGSGKTFTMYGEPPLHRGVIPRMVEELFSVLQRSAISDARVHVSLVELYLDRFVDLFSPDIDEKRVPVSGYMGKPSTSVPGSDLTLRQNSQGAFFLVGVRNIFASSANDVLNLLMEGTAKRQVHATAMNESSSRSHLIFSIELETSSFSSVITFVDLAGSERISKSHSTGERFKEAQHINKNLSSLGDVICALSSQGGTAPSGTYIPYRNSKLTQLLQIALGGNSKTVLFANICPNEACVSETLSTLGFASRVKQIKNPFIRNLRVKKGTLGDK
jgi:hypothetical protein